MARASKRLPNPGVHTVRYGWGHVTPHLPPWIAWLSLPLLALLARHFSTGSIPAAMAAAMGILIVIAGLTGFTWHVFHARGHSIRVHASLSVGAAGLWLLIALVAGLRAPVIWWIWALGGIGVCAAWTLRRVARGEGKDTHADDGGQRALTDAVGLAGARIERPRVEGRKVKATMQLAPGEHTTADAQAAARRIDSKLGLRRGATRVIENPDDESRPRIEIIPKDPLVKRIEWAGPNAPGESIAEVIEFATRDDATRAGLWFPGQDHPVRVAAHFKVAGMTGAGKTKGGLIICANAITRPDAGLIYIDPVKGIQSVGPIVDGVDLPIIERPKAVAFMKRLPTLIRTRTDWLGRNGFDQWEPGCGIQYLIVWIEESADLIADSTSFTKTTEQARSAGISLVASQQRWSHDRVDTSARANFGGGICFGVDNQDSAQMVLSDETIDANAAPWVWKNTKPGYLYLEAPGVDSQLWPVPARADWAEKAHLAEVVAEFGSPGLDDVTAAAIGALYADHVSLVGEGKAPWQKPMVTATRMPAGVVEAYEDVDDEEIDDENVVPEQPEPGFMDDIDPEQDIPEDDDPILAIGGAVPQIRPGRSEAVALLEAELKERAAAGSSTIEPKDLVEFRLKVGRSPGWLSGELSRLVEEGLLSAEPDRGVYGLPVPVAA